MYAESAAVFRRGDERWNRTSPISVNSPSLNLTNEAYTLILYIFKI